MILVKIGLFVVIGSFLLWAVKSLNAVQFAKMMYTIMGLVLLLFAATEIFYIRQYDFTKVSASLYWLTFDLIVYSILAFLYPRKRHATRTDGFAMLLVMSGFVTYSVVRVVQFGSPA